MPTCPWIFTTSDVGGCISQLIKRTIIFMESTESPLHFPDFFRSPMSLSDCSRPSSSVSPQGTEQYRDALPRIKLLSSDSCFPPRCRSLSVSDGTVAILGFRTHNYQLCRAVLDLWSTVFPLLAIASATPKVFPRDRGG